MEKKSLDNFFIESLLILCLHTHIYFELSEFRCECFIKRFLEENVLCTIHDTGCNF